MRERARLARGRIATPEDSELKTCSRIATPAWLLALALAAGAAFAAPDARSAETSRIEPRLREALQGVLPPEGIAVGVALRDDGLPRRGPERRAAIAARQQLALDALPGGSFRLKYRYEALGGFAGWATPAAVDALAGRPDVALVYLDAKVRATLAQGAALIGADVAAAQGVTGAGVRVAVLDTGIDSDHPLLLDDLVAQRCFCNDHPAPNRGCCPGGGETGASAEDDEGHGTSVAGIVTSRRSVAPGVAPDAEIVAVKVLSSTGGSSFSDVAAGLDWVLVNRASLGIRVVNLSLGDGLEHGVATASPCTGTNTANAIASLVDAGVVVFASSGNSGFDDGIEFPACVPAAISVGGVYDAALGSVSWCADPGCTANLCTDTATAADRFVCHSNSDELLDILAPDWRTETTALGGGVRNFGGTSAASPYAAGAAALLLDADPSLTPAQIRTLLASHGPAVTNPQNGLAFTRSDVGAALAEVLPGSFCVPDDPAACDDGDPCTADLCDAQLGCTREPIPGCPVALSSGSAASRIALALLLPAIGLAALARRALSRDRRFRRARPRAGRRGGSGA